MSLALVTLASHARPASTSGSGALVEFVLAAAGLMLLFGVMFTINFFKDLRAHEGVSMFKRRRVLKSGVAANATVLSSSRLERDTGVMESAYYSNVYEVGGPGGELFRAKGIEEMPTGLAVSGYLSLDLKVGETVAVKYDLVDHTIVMVNPFVKQHEAERENAQRERTREDERNAELIAQKEKEARLLRGEPPS